MKFSIFLVFLVTVNGYALQDNNQNEKAIIQRISERKCDEIYSKCTPLPGRLEVVGGTEAFEREFPHMALIGWKSVDNLKTEWLCGGTLISERFVVTAAHCTNSRNVDLNPDPKLVRLGEKDISSDLDDGNVQDIDIAEVITHPQYKAPVVYNDIALLKLAKDIVTTDFVHPACLYQEHEIERTLTATGWGRTGFGDQRSNVLLKVDLNPVENEDCSAHFPKNRRVPNGIPNNVICAGATLEKDTCQGDSGGPLVLKNGSINCLYRLVGVTSFGEGCGSVSPGAYTRISSYIDWIEAVVWPQ